MINLSSHFPSPLLPFHLPRNKTDNPPNKQNLNSLSLFVPSFPLCSFCFSFSSPGAGRRERERERETDQTAAIFSSTSIVREQVLYLEH
ncbi:hypothetical protein SCA6_007281 [Theobroma cacao]